MRGPGRLAGESGLAETAFCQVIPSAGPNLWYTVAALAEGGRPLDAVAKQISRSRACRGQTGGGALVAPRFCGHGKRRKEAYDLCL